MLREEFYNDMFDSDSGFRRRRFLEVSARFNIPEERALRCLSEGRVSWLDFKFAVVDSASHQSHSIIIEVWVTQGSVQISICGHSGLHHS